MRWITGRESTLGDGIEENPVSWLAMEISQTFLRPQQWLCQCKFAHRCVVLSHTAEVFWGGGTHWLNSGLRAVVCSTSYYHCWDLLIHGRRQLRKVPWTRSLLAWIQFTWESAAFFVLVCLHIWPRHNFLTLPVHGVHYLFQLLCATSHKYVFFRMFVTRALFKCQHSAFPEGSASIKLCPYGFQGVKGPLKWPNLLTVWYWYSCPLVSMGDWVQDLLPIPKSADSQVPHLKQCSVCI